jgi:hypothetical protein
MLNVGIIIGPIKDYYQNGSSLYIVKKVFFNTSFYISNNVDGSPYANCKNQYKLKRVFDILL